MRKIAITVLAAAIVLAASACQRNNNGAPDDTAPVSPPAGTAPAGTAPAASPTGTAPAAGTVNAEAVYQKQCIACHAADLHGGVGPNLQKVGSTMAADAIAAKISAGGGGMPAFKGVLTDDEINGLADWLSTKK